MRNHWLKRHKHERWMEDAFVIYHRSREKVKEIPLGRSFSICDQRHLPKVEWVDKAGCYIFDYDTGPPIFPDDLDMSNEILSHHHNWEATGAYNPPPNPPFM